jgi:hypothetical protein
MFWIGDIGIVWPPPLKISPADTRAGTNPPHKLFEVKECIHADPYLPYVHRCFFV